MLLTKMFSQTSQINYLLKKQSVISVSVYVKSGRVALHFNECKHEVSHLRFMGIQVVNMPKHGGKRYRLLLQTEAFLQMLTPNGLNEDFSFLFIK